MAEPKPNDLQNPRQGVHERHLYLVKRCGREIGEGIVQGWPPKRPPHAERSCSEHNRPRNVREPETTNVSKPIDRIRLGYASLELMVSKLRKNRERGVEGLRRLRCWRVSAS